MTGQGAHRTSAPPAARIVEYLDGVQAQVVELEREIDERAAALYGV
ncbi:MAG: hypothetical protein V3T90_10745 [Anaerolineae bacterium]